MVDKKSKKIFIILAIAIVACSLCAAAAFLLWKNARHTERGNEIAASKEDILYVPSDDEIAFDKESAYIFYANQLIVLTMEDLSAEEILELAALVDGTVIGKMNNGSHGFQLRVDADTTADLDELADRLMEDDRVLYAAFDVPGMEESCASNSPDELQVIGTNAYDVYGTWWADAIGAYDAWQFDEDVRDVPVGVIDNGFDRDHDELKGHIRYDGIANDHGTHVAGLIAAEDNHVGIRGISAGSTLVCGTGANQGYAPWYDDVVKADVFDEVASKAETFGSALSVMYQITDMIMGQYDGYPAVRVINISKGRHLTYDMWKGSLSFYETIGKADDAKLQMKCSEKDAILYMMMIAQLHADGYTDFVCVQSAGNGINNSGDLMGVFNSAYNGYFSGINPSVYLNLPRSLKDKLETLGVNYPIIASHFLIVGATEDRQDKAGRYQMTAFSNFGYGVDIVAPGQDILSTLKGNRYGLDSGTSMSAPIVTGALAYLLSLDDQLTSMEAKDILINTADHAMGPDDKITWLTFNYLAVKAEHDLREYRHLNLAAAAKAVMKHKYEGTPLPLRSSGRKTPYDLHKDFQTDDLTKYMGMSFDEVKKDFGTLTSYSGLYTADNDSVCLFFNSKRMLCSGINIDSSAPTAYSLCDIRTGMTRPEAESLLSDRGWEKHDDTEDAAAYEFHGYKLWITCDEKGLVDSITLDDLYEEGSMDEPYVSEASAGGIINTDSMLGTILKEAGAGIDNVISCRYDDIDNDGDFETFMLVGSINPEDGGSDAALWFGTVEEGKISVQKLEDDYRCWMFQNGEAQFVIQRDPVLLCYSRNPEGVRFAADESAENPNVDIWTVVDNKPVKMSVSNLMETITEKFGGSKEIPEGLLDFLYDIDPVINSFDYPSHPYVFSEAENVLGGILSIPGTDFSTAPFESETLYDKDPLDKLDTVEGYHKITAESVDWVLKNVYNVSDSRIMEMKERLNRDEPVRSYDGHDYVNKYYADGFYYVNALNMNEGWLSDEKHITSVQKEGDYLFVTFYDFPEYKLDYSFSDISDPDEDPNAIRHTAVVKQKEDRGVSYWSLYYYDVPFETIDLSMSD